MIGPLPLRVGLLDDSVVDTNVSIGPLSSAGEGAGSRDQRPVWRRHWKRTRVDLAGGSIGGASTPERQLDPSVDHAAIERRALTTVPSLITGADPPVFCGA